MSVLVLGIGNLIMADDGIGVKVVQRLQQDYRFPPEVTILDGGTLGLDLLPFLEGVERLLMVDAVETGWEPGTVVRLEGEELPVALKTKLSPHQVGLQDLLAVAELQGFSPKDMVLWGVQPAVLDMGMDLSSPVAAQMDTLVDRVLAELAGWGIGGQPIAG